MVRITRAARTAVAGAVLAACLALPAPAQVPTNLLGRQAMDSASIARAIAQSGLSRAQLQERLRRSGYDPSLADSYFPGAQPRAGGGGDAVGGDSAVLEALYGTGVMAPDVMTEEQLAELDSLAAAAEADTTLEVFGREVFRRPSNQYAPMTTGPVGPGYRFGPGDELILLLSGDVEQLYSLFVSREGAVFIPDVGQVPVNGMTLEQLEDALFLRLGRIYSGLTRGAGATTRFDISLGRLRTNQVRVVGEVRRPGAYQVSSVATVLEALYLAGGPADHGSFRTIRVRRAGQVAAELDLYPYLLDGRSDGDVRLQEADVVFVPVVGSQVRIRGQARREAIFELVPGDDLSDLIGFAGGLRPDARMDRVQVDRVVPSAERDAGVDRVLIDVPLMDALAGVEPFDLRDGDHVQVFGVLDTRRNRVDVTGAVWRPGTYELTPASTVGSLVERAGGLVDDALDADVQVVRLDPETGERSLLRVALDAEGSAVPLREFDEVRVFGLDALLEPDSVGIYGQVQRPGRYSLAGGMTAEDLVLRAGGFRRGALPWEAEIVRFERDPAADREIAVSEIVSLRAGLPYPDSGVVSLRPAALTLTPATVRPLVHGDEVYVRRLPQFRAPQRVQVDGEVVAPGSYVLIRQDETVSSVLARAGGLTQAANPEGLRLFRGGILVGVDYARAVANPGTVDDPVLVDGDRIELPVRDQTVLVQGEVVFESRVAYREGMDFDSFIRQAGGYGVDADASRASVEYANGERAAVRRLLWIFKRKPQVRPGSRIFVPREPVDLGIGPDLMLGRIVSITTSFAALIVAIDRLAN